MAGFLVNGGLHFIQWRYCYNPKFGNGVAQKDLSWEKSTQWNIGTDIEFQNGKYAFIL